MLHLRKKDAAHTNVLNKMQLSAKIGVQTKIKKPKNVTDGDNNSIVPFAGVHCARNSNAHKALTPID